MNSSNYHCCFDDLLLGENVVLLTKSDNDDVHVYFVKVLQFFILHQLVQRKGTQSVLQFVVSKSCKACFFLKSTWQFHVYRCLFGAFRM